MRVETARYISQKRTLFECTTKDRRRKHWTIINMLFAVNDANDKILYCTSSVAEIECWLSEHIFNPVTGTNKIRNENEKLQPILVQTHPPNRRPFILLDNKLENYCRVEVYDCVSVTCAEHKNEMTHFSQCAASRFVWFILNNGHQKALRHVATRAQATGHKCIVLVQHFFRVCARPRRQ